MIKREDFSMGDGKEIFQCNCGHIHKVNKPQGDNIYETLWCEKCRRHTRQLRCGDDEDWIYYLYDPVNDSRFYDYNYKTK